MIEYAQTRGGDYNSRPAVEDILAEMLGEEWNAQSYADRGHGEYIANVATAAATLKAAGVPPTVEAVGAVRFVEVER